MPELVEARALLRAGTCDVHGNAGAYIARSRIVPLGTVIGSPHGSLLRRVLSDVPDNFELLVQAADVGHVRAALRTWHADSATMHVRPPDAPPEPGPPTGIDTRIADPPDAASIYSLPENWRVWAAASAAFATAWTDGRPVAICEAVAVTESYWEVGIGTLDRYRRRGYARAAYLALAGAMSAKGLRAVWGSLDANEPSLEMARGLGFRPVGRVWVMGV